MVDTICAMAMRNQDRSLLTNNNYCQLITTNFCIAIIIFNRVNREKKCIAVIAIITRLSLPI